jgi:hypothetical protein
VYGGDHGGGDHGGGEEEAWLQMDVKEWKGKGFWYLQKLGPIDEYEKRRKEKCGFYDSTFSFLSFYGQKKAALNTEKILFRYF